MKKFHYIYSVISLLIIKTDASETLIQLLENVRDFVQNCPTFIIAFCESFRPQIKCPKIKCPQIFEINVQT